MNARRQRILDWDTDLSIAYGQSHCYRCRERLRKGDRVHTMNYRPYRSQPNLERWKVYHVDCKNPRLDRRADSRVD